MKKHNLLAVILLAALMSNCRGTGDTLFSINQDALKAQYFQKDKIALEILNPKAEKIDSVVYTFNNKKVGTAKGPKFSYPLTNQKLGYHNVKAQIFSDGTIELDSTRIEIISDVKPKFLKYDIVNTYPHDVTAYTEGLEFHNGFLYEGTGNGEGPSGKKGVSSLRKVDYKTGKVVQSVEYPETVFGEGISVLKGKIYQLTYKNNEAYVYDANTLTREKTIPYFRPMEGWGMTNDGTYLYYNDGTETIYKIDPATFQPVDNIKVYSEDLKIPAVNELEWVDGKIYSNIYQKEMVLVINPNNGAVEEILDLSALIKKTTPLQDRDVLNGIAYNPATKTFFVTGKNWDKLFEIRIKR